MKQIRPNLEPSAIRVIRIKNAHRFTSINRTAIDDPNIDSLKDPAVSLQGAAVSKRSGRDPIRPERPDPMPNQYMPP